MSGKTSRHFSSLTSAAASVLVLAFVTFTLSAGPAMAQATGAEESGALEEVVVTAQKRTENVLDVPVSISVLQGETLEALHAASLIDYAAYTPGFVVTPNGSPGQVTLTLRGLAQLSPASSVGIYLDDTPVGTSSSGGGFRFVGSRFMNVQGRGAGRRANSSELASYHVVDLNAGLSNDRWDFSLFARNATNERAYIRDSFTFAPAYIVSAVLQPRTIGASVELKF